MLATSNAALLVLYKSRTSLRAFEIVDASDGQIAKYITRPWLEELCTKQLIIPCAPPKDTKPLYPKYGLTKAGVAEARKLLRRAAAHA